MDMKTEMDRKKIKTLREKAEELLEAGVANRDQLEAALPALVALQKAGRSQKRHVVETDAVISRVKEIESDDADGNRTVSYEYFVTYRNEAGEAVEARLGNPPAFAREGMQLRVKYLPEKPKYALAVRN